jgi:hypothetical protein
MVLPSDGWRVSNDLLKRRPSHTLGVPRLTLKDFLSNGLACVICEPSPFVPAPFDDDEEEEEEQPSPQLLLGSAEDACTLCLTSATNFPLTLSSVTNIPFASKSYS